MQILNREGLAASREVAMFHEQMQDDFRFRDQIWKRRSNRNKALIWTGKQYKSPRDLQINCIKMCFLHSIFRPINVIWTTAFRADEFLEDQYYALPSLFAANCGQYTHNDVSHLKHLTLGESSFFLRSFHSFFSDRFVIYLPEHNTPWLWFWLLHHVRANIYQHSRYRHI